MFLKFRHLTILIAFILAFSSTAAIIPVSANHETALSAPTITPATTAFVVGQSVQLEVGWSGGDAPYNVTLYQSSTNFCYGGSAIAAATFNPFDDVWTSPVTFTVSPTATTYYCATVTDTPEPDTTTTSGVALVYVVSAVNATITPAAATVDSGQSLTLKGVPTGGLAPYSYNWYDEPSFEAGQCDPTYQVAGPLAVPTHNTGALTTGTYYYDALVTDSTPGSPSNFICATATVTVNPQLMITSFITNPTILDLGHSATVTASVTWSGGTGPYLVGLYSGTSSVCAADNTLVTGTTPANPQTGVTGTSMLWTFAPPGSNIYYCVKITDSAYSPVTVKSSTSPLTVNPALTAPTLVITPSFGDTGDLPAALTATVSWLGGTSPYVVTFYSGSNPSCASDPISVIAVGPPSVTGTSAIFTLSTPASATYYCAAVTDSSAPPYTIEQTAATLFSINVPLAFDPPVVSPAAIDMSTPATVTYTVGWVGGSGPYTVTLYSSSTSSCSANPADIVAVLPGFNPLTGLTTTTAKFVFASPGENTWYCAKVVDSLGETIISNTPPNLVELQVNPDLSQGSPTLLLTPSPVDDQGQTTPVSAIVTWVGGTPTYNVKLTSGTSASCALDTTLVGTAQTGISGLTTTFNFNSPAINTYYCATISDSSSESVTSSSVEFTVNPPLTAVVSPATVTINSGTSQSLTTIVNDGTSPYTYQWYAATGCVSANILTGQTSDSYTTGVLTSTSGFSVKVTDNSPGTPASLSSVCASATVTVEYGPTGVATDAANGNVYVATQGNPYDTPGNVTIVNSGSMMVLSPSIEVGIQPWGIVVSPPLSGYTDGIVYVTNYGSGTVTAIDAFSNSVIATIGVGDNPKGVAIDSCFDLAYVANSGDDSVSVIDINPSDSTFNTVVSTINVGTGPQGVAVMNPGSGCPTAPSTVFVTNYGSDSVSAIQVAPSIFTPPYWAYHVTIVPVGNSPWGVAVNPNTDLAYVTNAGSGSVTVLNGATFATVHTVLVGGTPQGIAVDPSTLVAYVAMPSSNTGLAVSLSTYTTTTIPLPLGSAPQGVALLLTSNYAFVSNAGSNVVSVIDINPLDSTYNTVVDTVIV
jgi:YVTN family beta-propeller protein